MAKLVAKNNFITLLDRHGKALQPRGASQDVYTSTDTGRLLSDLPYADYTAKATLQGNVDRIRARARHLERNNDIVRRALYLVEQNVVGPNGVKFVSLAKRARTDDKKAQELVTREWVRFIKSADIRLRYQSFRQSLKLISRRRVVDGEAFVELLPGFNNKTRFSYRLIDPSHIPVGLSDEKKRISMGIEYDANWVPVAYYVSDAKGAHTFSTGMFGSGKYRRVPAESMLHSCHSLHHPSSVFTCWISTRKLP
jgi:capsid protein